MVIPAGRVDALVALLQQRGLLAGVPTDAIAALLETLEPISLQVGETLIRQGSTSEDAFILIRGRLAVFVEAADGEQMVNHLTPGTTVGEMAMLTGDPRSATVRALWPSELIRLSRADCTQLMASHPLVLSNVARGLSEKLREANLRAGPATAKVIALSPLSEDPALWRLGGALAEALGRSGAVARLTGEARRRVQGDARPAEALLGWLDQADARARWVLIDGDPQDPTWVELIERNADLALVIADGDAPPHAPPARVTPAVRRELVLLHRTRPRNGAAWQRALAPALVHRVHMGRRGDIERVARFVTGDAVALALSGGLFRGAAHIGVLRALEEAGQPIDLVCGTSIGAVVAGLAARGLHSTEVEARARAALSMRLFDLTIPIRSLIGGKRFERVLEDYFGEVDVDDLQVPYFATSNNLSRAEVVIHRSGRLRDAVRASIGLPPVMPPVRRGQELLVDGALLSNLPTDQVLEIARCRRIGVNLIPVIDQTAFATLPEGSSALRVVFSRLWPGRQRQMEPTALDLMSRAYSLSSVRDAARISQEIALYIEPDIGAFHQLSISAFDELVSRGYQAAKAALASNPTLRRPGEAGSATSRSGQPS